MDLVRIPKEKIDEVWILVREYIKAFLIYSLTKIQTDSIFSLGILTTSINNKLLIN